MDIDRKTDTSMNTKHTTAEPCCKRHWLNSQEAGYPKAMGNRQVQMIAIGSAIGTGLFLGAGARLQMAGTSAGAGLSGLRHLLFLYSSRARRTGSSSPFQRQLRLLRPRIPRQKKPPTWPAGCKFVNWAMTGIVDITAVALYMHYWGAVRRCPAVGLRPRRARRSSAP